jgi:alcohol dehydrogenase class IV
MGLSDNDIDMMSRNALKDICSFTNPRQGTFEDIKKILKVTM